MWISLTIDTTLLGCDTTKTLCWLYSILGDWITAVINDLWGEQVTVEDEDDRIVVASMIKATVMSNI